MEFKTEICKNDWTELTGNTKLALIDGAGHTILSKRTLFPNGAPCVSNPYFGLYDLVKSYLKKNKDDLKTTGRTMCYKIISTKFHDVFSAVFFVN